MARSHHHLPPIKRFGWLMVVLLMLAGILFCAWRIQRDIDLQQAADAANRLAGGTHSTPDFGVKALLWGVLALVPSSIAISAIRTLRHSRPMRPSKQP